jgi:hypothetical protein
MIIFRFIFEIIAQIVSLFLYSNNFILKNLIFTTLKKLWIMYLIVLVLNVKLPIFRSIDV